MDGRREIRVWIRSTRIVLDRSDRIPTHSVRCMVRPHFFASTDPCQLRSSLGLGARPSLPFVPDPPELDRLLSTTVPKWTLGTGFALELALGIFNDRAFRFALFFACFARGVAEASRWSSSRLQQNRCTISARTAPGSSSGATSRIGEVRDGKPTRKRDGRRERNGNGTNNACRSDVDPSSIDI